MQSSFVMNLFSSGVSSFENHWIFHHFCLGTPEWDAIEKKKGNFWAMKIKMLTKLLVYIYLLTARSRSFVLHMKDLPMLFGVHPCLDRMATSEGAPMVRMARF